MRKYAILITTLVTVTHLQAQTDFKVISTQTEKTVIPEGITVDPNNGTMYVSSIALNKIIAITGDGQHKDFITANQDGFLEGLGLKIDPKHHWLWAVSNKNVNNWFVSQLHAFDVKTGIVQQHYILKDTTRHLFNDLIFHANGKVYITDTYGSALYEADPSTQKLNVFIHDSLLAYPNGICSDSKGRTYIATYSHGLMQLNMVSKKLTQLKGNADSTKIYNLDGLVYWNNTIIGIYNGAEENKNNAVVQYFLNDNGDKIVRERIINKGNEFFHEPTTAAVYADKLYVLANSYLAAYNANKESVEGIENNLGPVTILVYNLK